MKTKRFIVAVVVVITGVLLFSSCHNNIPCAVYASDKIPTENIQKS